MMIKLLLPVLAGISIVLQGTLNRTSASHIGIISAVFLNAVVFLIFSAIVWFVMRQGFLGSELALAAKPLENLQLWQLIPGILGVAIVLCTPLAITYLGATVTFAVVICTQLCVSLLWDSFILKTPPSMPSLVGVAIMSVGVAFIIFGKR